MKLNFLLPDKVSLKWACEVPEIYSVLDKAYFKVKIFQIIRHRCQIVDRADGGLVVDHFAVSWILNPAGLYDYLKIIY